MPKQKTIRAIVCRPDQEPVVEDVGTDLSSMQRLVGGLVQCVPLGPVDVWCNESGRLDGLPLNRVLRARAREAEDFDAVIKLDDDLVNPGEVGEFAFYGDIFVTGRTRGGNACSLTDAEVSRLADMLALARSAP